MFGNSFAETLGTLLAILVFIGFLAGVAFGALALYRAGVKSRAELERRAGVLEVVQKKDGEEREEIRVMDARRKDLGRG